MRCKAQTPDGVLLQSRGNVRRLRVATGTRSLVWMCREAGQLQPPPPPSRAAPARAHAAAAGRALLHRRGDIVGRSRDRLRDGREGVRDATGAWHPR